MLIFSQLVRVAARALHTVPTDDECLEWVIASVCFEPVLQLYSVAYDRLSERVEVLFFESCRHQASISLAPNLEVPGPIAVTPGTEHYGLNPLNVHSEAF